MIEESKFYNLNDLLDKYFNFINDTEITNDDYDTLKNYLLHEKPLIINISKELKKLGKNDLVFNKMAVLLLRLCYGNLSLSRKIKRQEKGRSSIAQKVKAGIGKTYKWDYLKDEIDEKWNKDPKKNFRNCVKSVVLERLDEKEDTLILEEYLRKNKDLEGLVGNIYRFFYQHYNYK
jgi:hypothetical protein